MSTIASLFIVCWVIFLKLQRVESITGIDAVDQIRAKVGLGAAVSNDKLKTVAANSDASTTAGHLKPFPIPDRVNTPADADFEMKIDMSKLPNDLTDLLMDAEIGDELENLREHFNRDGGFWPWTSPWGGWMNPYSMYSPMGSFMGNRKHWNPYPYPWAPGWPPYLPDTSTRSPGTTSVSTTSPVSTTPAPRGVGLTFSVNDINSLLLQLIALVVNMQAQNRKLTEWPITGMQTTAPAIRGRRPGRSTGGIGASPATAITNADTSGDAVDTSIDNPLRNYSTNSTSLNNTVQIPGVSVLFSTTQSGPTTDPSLLRLPQIVTELLTMSAVPWWAQMLGFLGQNRWSAIEDFERNGNDPWPFARIFGSPFTRTLQYLNGGNSMLPLPLAQLVGNAYPVDHVIGQESAQLDAKTPSKLQEKLPPPG